MLISITYKLLNENKCNLLIKDNNKIINNNKDKNYKININKSYGLDIKNKLKIIKDSIKNINPKIIISFAILQ